MSERLILEGWGGQNCDIEIIKRDAHQGCDPVFASFRSQEGYGSPTLELSEVRSLLERMEAMV